MISQHKLPPASTPTHNLPKSPLRYYLKENPESPDTLLYVSYKDVKSLIGRKGKEDQFMPLKHIQERLYGSVGITVTWAQYNKAVSVLCELEYQIDLNSLFVPKGIQNL